MDYRDSLNLPRTSFPMRANLPALEPRLLERWRDMDLYRLARQAREGRPKFVLHDGPPYANGEIHLGHALNKILKDVVQKYWCMQGRDTPFVPGYDTHGLPIEMRALEALGVDRHAIDPLALRAECRAYALRHVEIMTRQFERLGVRGDWAHPYITLDPAYEAAEIRVFGAMYRRGLIYRDLGIVHWCPQCETALAEAELEYHETTSPSLFVALPVTHGAGTGLGPGDALVVWTTTPWTLPANRAVAVHPEAPYVVAVTPQGRWVVAAARVEAFSREVGAAVQEIVPLGLGASLTGVEVAHPWEDGRAVPVVVGEHVTTTEGTGLVHIAPGHGEEDFALGRRYRLETVVAVDGQGRFVPEFPDLAGQRFAEAGPGIVARLRERGRLVHAGKIRHSYPMCWRCHGPTVQRATRQWFGSIAKIREDLVAAIRQVRFVPAWGQERFLSMTVDRADWCISRQRAWGLPIPVFYCTACEAPLVTEESVEAVASLVEREGSDAWWRVSPEEILPAGTRCPSCGNTGFRKETDILDVWFDSGSSHAAVLAQHPDLTWPADMYLEGSDQFRGWFNSSLTTAVAVRGQAPYREVLSHGFVLDGEGRKMSKSLGNVISPADVVSRYGADILRLWVTSSDFKSDLRLSDEILRQVAEGYRKIRNTLRFLLGNLWDFDPRHEQPLDHLPELERFILDRLSRLVARVTSAYEAYDLHIVYHALLQFCAVDLSALYLDVRKDVLYCAHPEDPVRRGAQTVLYRLAHALVRLMAPVLTFTAEEVWEHLPKPADAPVLVQLAYMPRASDYPRDEGLAKAWEALLAVRDRVLKALEEARAAGQLGSSLEAAVHLAVPADLDGLLRPRASQLAELFLVSQVEMEPGDKLRVRVVRAAGSRCERCWTVHPRVGEDPAYPDVCPRCAGVLRRLQSSPAAKGADSP